MILQTLILIGIHASFCIMSEGLTLFTDPISSLSSNFDHLTITLSIFRWKLSRY